MVNGGGPSSLLHANAERRHEEELRRELAKPFEHDAALAQLRERRDTLVHELQLRDDGDVVVREPETPRLAPPSRAAGQDAEIAR
jgi:hypothetical protein